MHLHTRKAIPAFRARDTSRSPALSIAKRPCFGSAGALHICSVLSCGLGVLALSSIGDRLGYSSRTAMAEQEHQHHCISSLETFALRTLVPEGSFPASAVAYAALLRARMFKRLKNENWKNERGEEHAGAAGTGTATLMTATAGAAAPAAEGGRTTELFSLTPATTEQSLIGQEDYERLQKTRTWKALLHYPQELFPGEYCAKEVPNSFALDWTSLSTKKVPGFEPRKPAPWMHPADVTVAPVVASYINVDDRGALQDAARCSSPRAFAQAAVPAGGGEAAGTAAEGIETSAEGYEFAKHASAAVEISGTCSGRLERQRDAGSLHFGSVKLFTPMREKASQRPLNPILFTGSIVSSYTTNKHREELSELHSPYVKQEQLQAPVQQGQLQYSAGWWVTRYPEVRLKGRGILGHWGPNRTADVVLTAKNPCTNKLQIALIRRTDGSGQYAFPGGFVDEADNPPVLATAVREFLEEAISSAEPAATAETGIASEEAITDTSTMQGATARKRPARTQRRVSGGVKADALRAASGKEIAKEISRKTTDATELKETVEALQELFGEFNWDATSGKVTWEREDQIRPGNIVYAGYVDDMRNTDNAWIETVAFHWHVPPYLYNKIHLRAGDDAAKNSAAFYDVRDDPRLAAEEVNPLKNLYSSHSGILRKTLETHFPTEVRGLV